MSENNQSVAKSLTSVLAAKGKQTEERSFYPPQNTKSPVNRSQSVEPAGYRIGRLKRLILSNGRVIKPGLDGIFRDLDSEALQLLEYFESLKRDLVQKI